MNKSPPTDVLMELTSTIEGTNHEAIAQEMICDICQFCKNTANEILENEIRALLENQIMEQVFKKLQEKVYVYENLVNMD